MYDNVYFIGLTGNVKKPVLASRNLENVVYKGYADEAGVAGEQLFFRE